MVIVLVPSVVTPLPPPHTHFNIKVNINLTRYCGIEVLNPTKIL